MKLSTWYEVLHKCETKGEAYVIITVINAAGSTPRDGGTKMIVTADSQYDTIGGGHLEYEAVQQARGLLAKNQACQQITSFPLSSKLGQCCGGAVKLLFEVMMNHQQHIAIFGAGHVAQALVPILSQLPLQIIWVDSREKWLACSDELPNVEAHSSDLADQARHIVRAHSNVRAISNDIPDEELTKLPENSWIVIVTHNHQLDYKLVETALKNLSSKFIGMIGSSTKAKRFKTKLEHKGFSEQQLTRLISPIGNLSITGKRPIEVAVSIAAQIINLLNKKETVASNLSSTERIKGEA